MVGLAAGDGVPVPVASHRHRVDRVDLAVGGAQARHEQAARGFDRHRDRFVDTVADSGQQLDQLGGGEPAKIALGLLKLTVP